MSGIPRQGAESGSGAAPALSRIDRNMSLAFSGVVLALMLIVAAFGWMFYARVSYTNERALQQTIAGLLADSINRVSFSGKYHARLLVEQIAASQPRISGIVIVDADGGLIAHSDSETGATYDFARDEAIVRQVLQEETTVFRAIERGGISIEQVAMPFRSGYRNRTSGVILAGISTEETRKAEALTRMLLAALVLLLSLVSLAITRILSKKIAGPVIRLAWQFQKILEHAPLLIRISDRDGSVHASSSPFSPRPEDDASILDSEIEAVFETNQDIEREVVRPLRNKAHTFLAMSFPVLKDKRGLTTLACSIGLDISDRKRIEEQLRAEKEFTEAALDSQQDTFFLFEPSTGKAIRWNRAFNEVTGYSDEEIRGMPAPNAFYSPEDLERAGAFIQETMETGSGMIELELLCKDGRKVPSEYSVSVLRDEAGLPKYLISIGRDVTDRKRAEEQRLSLERQVQHAQKLESLGVLAGGIAHDFNNLLMAISGNASLALDELSQHAPARACVVEIEKASKRAAELAKQMLAYSGKGRFVIEAIDLNEFVQEMAHLLEVSISKKVVLKYDFVANLPVFDGDVTQIRQIIMNLITNASEAIGDRSGTISLSTAVRDCDRAYLDQASEVLSAGLDAPLPEGVYTCLEVADTGCGMDAETTGKIFDPFFTTKFTGRGLGMAAVLGIVRGHRGALKVESGVGKGTTFRVLFPAKEAADNDLPAPGKGEPAKKEWCGSGHVLIADDEESIRAVGKRILERMGFRVLLAPDGCEAVEMFREHAKEIVCVLLDLTMPRMNGEETFRELRAIRPDVQVILCSGYNEQDAMERFAGTGLAGFLQKPYSMAALKAELMEVLGEGFTSLSSGPEVE